jgi:septal ring factor EnvC (AmiA/AmiB activator)
VASKPQGDLIREQGEEIAKLVQRMDHIRADLVRIETVVVETGKRHQEIDRQLAITARDVERVEKKLDESLARRWDLWKLVIAAFLGAVLAFIGNLLVKSVDRPPQQNAGTLKR